MVGLRHRSGLRSLRGRSSRHIQRFAPSCEALERRALLSTLPWDDASTVTAIYEPTADTKIRSDLPDQTFGDHKRLQVAGSPDYSTLIKWDISDIPSNATVLRATISLNILDESVELYPIYAVKRDWSEDQTTFNSAMPTVPWQVPGAAGPEDRGTTVLGTVNANGIGPVTIDLNTEGIALVQSWVTDPSGNLGLIFQNYDVPHEDGMDFYSREANAEKKRPKLSVSYTSTNLAPSPVAATTSITTSRLHEATADTKIGSDRPDEALGTRRRLYVAGRPDYSTLFQWDVTDIPSNATVMKATISLYIEDASVNSYPIYEVKRAWSEDQATFNNASNGVPWQVPGAAGSNDRGSKVLGTVITTTIGPATIDLNTEGVAVVQSWVNDPTRNLGLIFQNYDDNHKDGLDLNSREALDARKRPTLVIDYSTADGPVNQPPTVSAGRDQTTVKNSRAVIQLDATVTDDGLPGPMSTTWSRVSGPAPVSFANASSVDTSATFTEAGTYVLRLTADDGALRAFDELTVTVQAGPGLVGYWSFEEGSGSITADLSGAGHPGVLNGPTWSTAGKVRNALQFDGINDFVDTGNWDIAANQLTIAAWIHADSFGGIYRDGRIVSKATGDRKQDHFWMLSTIAQGSETRLRFRLKTDGNTDVLNAGSGNLSTGQWIHVAAVYDGAMMRLYMNGTEVGAMPKSGAISTKGNVPVWIGNNPVTLAQPFHGRIDDVRIYDKALTALEILALISQSPAPTNQAPAVSAGPNASVVVSAALALDGTVSDDGLPNPPGAVTTTWSRVSGPAPVSFANAAAVDTSATFSQAGTYVLRLTADDGGLQSFDELTVTVTPPPNSAPSVAAGPDQSIVVSASLTLDGTVSDDGLPNPPGAVTTTWSRVSGPAPVSFANASAVDTSATFTQAGTYVLRLTANDGGLQSFDELTVTVTPPPNSAPSVAAGPDQSVVVSASLTLDGTVSDDGLPSPPGAVTTTWSKISGPGTVTFTDQTSVDTTATFSQVGTYILRLQATDGQASASDEVSISVVTTSGLVGYWSFDEGSGSITADLSGAGHDGVLNGPTWSNSLWFDGINDYVDTGNWDVTSSQLTIAAWIKADSFVGTYRDGRILSKATGDQTQDHYWMLSTIAQGSETRLRFRLKTNGTTDTLIAGSGNLLPGQWYHVAAVYDAAMMRVYVNAAQVGSTSKSGAISTSGSAPIWIGNNPVSRSQPFHGHVDDVRVYDRALTASEISALMGQTDPLPPPSPTNQAPSVDAGPDRNVLVSSNVALNGTVSDDGLPNPPGVVTTTWSKVSGPGVVTFANASSVDTTASFSQSGSYVLRLQASDGVLTSNDTVTITANNEQQVTGFFVSPDGLSSGDGSITRPWNLQTALSHPAAVQPGDTIWLRGGTYRGAFTSTLRGTATNRITVRAYPGEHVKIDLYDGTPQALFDMFSIRSDYTDYRDLEIFSSNPVTRYSTSFEPDPIARGQVDIGGIENRLINMSIHDLINGVGFWKQATGGEIYGSFIYNNGWHGPIPPQGHGIYTQNYAGHTKRYRENIIFNQFGSGVHAYGGASGPLDSMHFVGNVIFQSGLAAGSGATPAAIPQSDFLLGGTQPASDIVLTENYTYQSGTGNSVSIGYVFGGSNRNVTLNNNYFYSGRCDWPKPWESITANGNICDDLSGPYAPSAGFSEQPNPTGTKVVVRTNAWEPGRGHIVIYNWDKRGTVEVDLSSILATGASYEIYHAYNLSTPLHTGIYTGGTVPITMRDTTPPTPLGEISRLGTPIALPKEFGAFLVRTRSTSAANLQAADGAAAVASETALLQDQLRPIVDFAISQYAATPLSAPQKRLLTQIQFGIADLPGAVLGQARQHVITIDENAAGHGWFIDSTPDNAEEFHRPDQRLGFVAKQDSMAAHRIDLLTVVMHELGHVLGLDHDAPLEFMSETLSTGVRGLLDIDAADHVFCATDD